MLESVMADVVGNGGEVGALVSGHAAVDAESEALPAERFPVASTASTATRWVTPHVSPVNVKDVEVGDATAAPSR
jgi:hypothetical protein